MLKNLKNKIRENIQIFGLIFLIAITVVSTSYFNFKKNIQICILIFLITLTAVSTSYFNFRKNNNIQVYNNFIDNIYFKKTLSYLVDKLEPKYKKVKHKIQSGETFDKILESYSIEKSEIIKIKNSLKGKVNLNKLNTKQIIQFNLDKTNNKIS